MRVLFTMFPSYVHLFPLASVAWALQNAGHEVRVASHGSFAAAIERTGLVPVSLGDPNAHEARLRPDAKQPATPQEVYAYIDAMGLDPVEREHWIVFYQWLLCPISDYVRVDLPEAAELVSLAKAWKPDLVLWDPIFPAGAVAARVCGAAHGRYLGSAMDFFAYSLERLAAHRDKVRAAGLPENPLADMLAPLADQYGVEVDHELLVGQWTVDPLPKGLHLETSTFKVPVRWIPYTGGAVAQTWLTEPPKRPRVAISLGESTRRYIAGDWGRAPKLLEAVSDLDIEVIATLNQSQLDGVERVPDNVRAIEWVPLTQLIPSCSALIHHGGNGTSASATANKVPQLVCDTDESLLLGPARTGADDKGVYRAGREYGVREEADENDRASWVHPAKHIMATPSSTFLAERGAGVRLNHQTMSVDEIRKQILRVLTEPSFQDGANSIYETWLATPSPNELVPVLERLTAEHRGRR